jgi:hypothetical protein
MYPVDSSRKTGSPRISSTGSGIGLGSDQVWPPSVVMRRLSVSSTSQAMSALTHAPATIVDGVAAPGGSDGWVTAGSVGTPVAATPRRGPRPMDAITAATATSPASAIPATPNRCHADQRRAACHR